MITIKTEAQIRAMREAGVLLNKVLEALKAHIAPGVTTLELDALAERMIRDAGATPSFKGYEGFPATICASPDDRVVHGIPNHAPLREGQILSVDCGVILDGWQSDSAFTAQIGEVPTALRDLIRVTEECFWIGIEEAREGNRLGDIGHAIQQHAEDHGYGVVRDLCGHGIGRAMHEDPSVPNYGEPGRGVRLKVGMTLAIEPMIALGTWRVLRGDDGWAVITQDHKPCAHYEHTIAITSGAPEILSLPGGRGT
jgi:methionyl aminopeptidase